MSRHPDDKLYPALATEWKATGPTTWEFKLRQGVKCHNGDPFTSADVKFSIERTYDPAAKTMVATVFTTIARVEAPDPYTVVFHTKQPDALLPARLAFYGGQIVPKKYLEQVGPDTFNAKPIGTGPIRLVSWTKDDKAVFDANPDYWGGKIDVDRVVLRSIPEMAPRVAALLKGEIDAMVLLTADHWDRVNQNASTCGTSALYARPLRPGRELEGAAAQQPAGQAGDVARGGPRGHREGALARAGYRPERPDRQGRQPLRRLAPAARLQPERRRRSGSRSPATRTSRSTSRPPPGSWRTTSPCPRRSRPCGRTSGSTWSSRSSSTRCGPRRTASKTFKGLWWSDPTSTLRDPDGMMWRLLGSGRAPGLLAAPGVRRARATPRGFSLDEKFRGEAYRKMTRIFFEHNPWIIVIQPFEDYGLQKYVEFTPNPNQQFEIRRFNLKLRRA